MSNCARGSLDARGGSHATMNSPKVLSADLGSKVGSEHPRAVLAGGSALNYFFHHVHALSGKPLYDLITVDGLVHVFCKAYHLVATRRCGGDILQWTGIAAQWGRN